MKTNRKEQNTRSNFQREKLFVGTKCDEMNKKEVNANDKNKNRPTSPSNSSELY